MWVWFGFGLVCALCWFHKFGDCFHFYFWGLEEWPFWCWEIGLLEAVLVFLCEVALINEWLIGSLGWWFGILGIPLSNNLLHKGIQSESKPPNAPKPLSQTISWALRSSFGSLVGANAWVGSELFTANRVSTTEPTPPGLDQHSSYDFILEQWPVCPA